MARLRVKLEMVDDDERPRLLVELDEPTRLHVDVDPLYVFARLVTLTERATEQLHEQALQLEQLTDRSRGRAA